METVVQIEKDIEDLSSLQKFDQSINLASFYHLYRCQIKMKQLLFSLQPKISLHPKCGY